MDYTESPQGRYEIELAERDAIEAEKERERLMPIFVRLYNAGYQAGHHETVEGGFVTVADCDKSTYHADVVSQILDELRFG